MKNDTSTLNEVWSKVMINELTKHGVRMFCISPGSQSSPFTIAAAENPLAQTSVHYDERGTAFHALAYAKATKEPTAIVVTSGTAVANLLPAVMEAHFDQVPLILITADRPPELRDTGANQTTDQVKVFEGFVRWQIDMPCPDSKISTDYIKSTIGQAFASSSPPFAGPVHLNCMVRKPFFALTHPSQKKSTSIEVAPPTFIAGKNTLESEQYKHLAEELSKYEKGVILVSGTAELDSLKPLYHLSHRLQWPIFPDVLSSVRSEEEGHGVIPYYDWIIKTVGDFQEFSPEAILQVGDRFVSQALLDWSATNKPKIHCHLSPHTIRKDPNHSVTHRIASDINHFLPHLSEHIQEKPPSQWLEKWKKLSSDTAHTIEHFFKQSDDLSEPLFFHRLPSLITSATPLFLSNSMAIRNADTLFCPKRPLGPIHCNRGLSGIDGNIASAAGIARGLDKPTLAILGDLAFLHDLNSLALVKNLPLKIIVINNDGGSIFSLLPISEKKELFTPYFQTPHGLELKHAASLFGLSYEKADTFDSIRSMLKDLSSPGIIEIQTPANQNAKIHDALLLHLKTRLNSPSLVSPC